MDDTVKTLGGLAIRRGLTVLGTWLAAKGVVQGDAGVTSFVGAAMVLVEVAYEGWNRYGMVLVNVQLAKMKGVHPAQNPVTPAAPASGTTLKVLAFFAVIILGTLMFSLPARAANAVPVPTPRPALSSSPFPSPDTAVPGKISSSAVQSNPLALIQKFTVADLQAAQADATANNDKAAAACYTALLTVVQSNVANPFPTTPGIFEGARPCAAPRQSCGAKYRRGFPGPRRDNRKRKSDPLSGRSRRSEICQRASVCGCAR